MHKSLDEFELNKIRPLTTELLARKRLKNHCMMLFAGNKENIQHRVPSAKPDI